MKTIISPDEDGATTDERVATIEASLRHLEEWDGRADLTRTNAELRAWMRAARQHVDYGAPLPFGLAALPRIMREPALVSSPLIGKRRPRPNAEAGLNLGFIDHKPNAAVGSLSGAYERRETLFLWLTAAFASRGERVPSAFAPAFFQEYGVRRIREGLRGLFPRDNPLARAASEAYAERWLTVIGSAHLPVSDLTATAIIRHHPDGDDALLGLRDGRLLSFFVPASAGRSNRAVIRRCEAEVSAVEQGGAPRLSRSRAPILEDLSHPEDPMDLPEVRAASLAALRGARGVSEAERRVLEDDLPRALADSIASAQDAVTSCLPADTREISGCFGMRGLDLLSWMSGSAGLRPTPDWRERRADAEDAFAYAGPMFYLAEEPGFRDAVSERRPLIPVIRALTGLSKAQLAHYTSRRTPSRPEEVLRDPAPFSAESLAMMSADQVRVGSWAASVLRCARPDQTRDAAAALAAKLMSSNPTPRVIDARDAIREIEERLVQGGAIDAHGERNASTEAFLRTVLYPATPKAMMAASESYHSGIHHRIASLGRHDRQILTSWDPLTMPLITPEIIVRELTSAMEIVNQGGKQSHCVGGYVPYVLQGRTLILSVEEPGAAMPLTTVEVLISGSGAQVSMGIAQHRGRFNREPTATEEAAAEAFLALNSGLLPGAIETYRASIRAAAAMGFGTASEAEASFYVMAPMLPEAAVRLGYSAIVAEAARRFESGEASPQVPVPAFSRSVDTLRAARLRAEHRLGM